MRMGVQMPSKMEWVLPRRQFRIPTKKIADSGQTREERPQQGQPEPERYLLQIDMGDKKPL